MLRGLHVEQKSDIIVTTSSNFSASRGIMQDHEGLIPVPAQPEFYFVVDCPSLHIVSGDSIASRQQSETDAGFSTFSHAFCPQCQQVVTRTRQIIITPGTPSPGSAIPASRISAGEVPRSFRPYSPPLPEVLPIQNYPSGRAGSISTTNAGSTKRLGIFSQLISLSTTPRAQTVTKSKKSSRSTKSVTSDSTSSTLPKFLSFCFSLSGENLILWKKDSQALVRIEVEQRGSRLLDLTDMLPASDEVRAVNIRSVAEGDGWISTLISHNRRLVLVVLHCSGLREESTSHFINEPVDHTALAISPDNSFIAVGFGIRIRLYHYQGCHQQWETVLTVPDFTIPAEVKFQVISFSSDSTTLVAATQRHDTFRSIQDDTISTHVWLCTRQPPAPQRMGSCKMPTDGQGLTSIHHSPPHALSLILGACSTPYPPFLPLSPLPLPPIPPALTEFRIRCAALAPPPNGHLAYVMDFRHRVLRVDMRARSIVPVTDLHLARGALAVHEEPAALGVCARGVVRVFWRRGAGLLVCVVVGRDGGRGLGECVNLRSVWDDASGGVG